MEIFDGIREVKTVICGNFNGSTIEWLVVDENDNSLTLLSKDILFKSVFGANREYTSSVVRSKITNNDLIKFNQDELDKMLECNEYGDKITLASFYEAQEFKHKHRACGNWYWLRSPHPSYYDYALMVGSDGSGSNAVTDLSHGGVRPIIILKKE